MKRKSTRNAQHIRPDAALYGGWLAVFFIYARHPPILNGQPGLGVKAPFATGVPRGIRLAIHWLSRKASRARCTVVREDQAGVRRAGPSMGPFLRGLASNVP